MHNILIIIIYYLFNYNCNYIEYVKSIIFLFYIATNVIYLGCWWSLQEDNWNEWWGWEFSEILSLMNLIACLVLSHKNKFYKNISYIYFFKNLIYWYLIINFLFVQIYLEDTMHNFINYLNLTILFWLTSVIYFIKSFYIHYLASRHVIHNNVFNFFTILNISIVITYFFNFIYLYLYWYLNNNIKSAECDYSFYVYSLFYLIVIILFVPNIKYSYLIKYHVILFLIIYYLLNTWNFHIEFISNKYLHTHNININGGVYFDLNKTSSFFYKTVTLFINNIITEFCLNFSYFYTINLIFILHFWLLCNIFYYIYIYYKTILWY